MNGVQVDSIPAIDLVVPTLHRPDEVAGLLDELKKQSRLPHRVIIVDGADPDDTRTRDVVLQHALCHRTNVEHVRSQRGTCVQRNLGLELSSAPWVALLDDDVRPEPDYFEVIVNYLATVDEQVGGVSGYRGNNTAATANSFRWKLYRRARLFSTFEPGRFDSTSGYPINSQLQPPFHGERDIDFMSTACAVYRRSVIDAGIRFDTELGGFGVLEDVLFSMRVSRHWRLVQLGDAHAVELRSPVARSSRREIGNKSVTNYYYVFGRLFGPLSISQRVRFWRFQAIEVIRIALHGLLRQDPQDFQDIRGRGEAIANILRSRSRAARGQHA